MRAGCGGRETADPERLPVLPLDGEGPHSTALPQNRPLRDIPPRPHVLAHGGDAVGVGGVGGAEFGGLALVHGGHAHPEVERVLGIVSGAHHVIDADPVGLVFVLARIGQDDAIGGAHAQRGADLLAVLAVLAVAQRAGDQGDADLGGELLAGALGRVAAARAQSRAGRPRRRARGRARALHQGVRRREGGGGTCVGEGSGLSGRVAARGC